MVSTKRFATVAQVSVAVMVFVTADSALSYGPQGHLIAGRVAAPMLCERAAAAVTELIPGEDLGEAGLWADRVRGNPAYADTGPWHYMNIADNVAVRDFSHPAEGDVLWAIDTFAARLADAELRRSVRVDALRFLVHFVVDIHQPLHVGLQEDRGGNTVRLRFMGEETNLHRFWDTDVIVSGGLSVRDYVRAVAADLADAGSVPVSLNPADWASEGLSLRPEVYAFGQAGGEPSSDYVRFAERTTRERLGLAARRLAGTLNEMFCD